MNCTEFISMTGNQDVCLGKTIRSIGIESSSAGNEINQPLFLYKGIRAEHHSILRKSNSLLDADNFRSYGKLSDSRNYVCASKSV